MTKYEEHIDAIVEESVAGLERVLSPAVLRSLRGVLAVTLETEPALRDLVNETAPVDELDDSAFRPVDLSLVVVPTGTEGKKQGGGHG